MAVSFTGLRPGEKVHEELTRIPQLDRWIRWSIPGHSCAEFLAHTATGMRSKFRVGLSTVFSISVRRAQLRKPGGSSPRAWPRTTRASWR